MLPIVGVPDTMRKGLRPYRDLFRRAKGCAGNVLNMVIDNLHSDAEFISIDEQANHDIVHLCGLGWLRIHATPYRGASGTVD
jgi:hypothetical protein